MGMKYLQMEGYQAHFLREKNIVWKFGLCAALRIPNFYEGVFFRWSHSNTWEEHGKPYMAQSLGGLCSCLLNAW